MANAVKVVLVDNNDIAISLANPLQTAGGGGGGGGNVTVVAQSAGLALDASLTQIQQTHSSVAGNGAYILDPSTGLPITYTAPTNTNTAQVNAVTVLTGTGAVGTGAQRIAVGTDTATIAGSAPSTVLNGNVAQVNAVTVLTGTGATGTGCQRVTVAVDAATIGGSAPSTTLTVQGGAASGVTAAGNPLLTGGRAATATPTAVTDGQAIAIQLGDTGKQIVLPYSIKENAVRGTTTATDTAAHTVIASAGGSLKNYITGLQLGRTDAGASAITVTCNDSASTVFIVPSGGASNIVLQTPLVTAAATAFQITSGTSVSTLYASAQGYVGL